MKKYAPWYLVVMVIAIIGLLITGFFLIGQEGPLNNGQVTPNAPLTNNGQSSGPKLLIPALLEDKNPAPGKAEFDLVVQYGHKEFRPGSVADTLGYNGDYLGPVIKVTKGDDVQINVNNTLDEPTTVHWHGLEVAGEMDGGPHNVILPKTVWQPHFTIDQPAATLWYHPHLLNKTGEQVYKGLAGLIYIEDENSLNLEIPKNYGVNDIPLIIQDKRFTQNGAIPYDLNMNDLMTGFFGNTVIVNGGINPVLEVKNEIIRLRILNGSNARTYDLNFSGNQKFYQIASDGGFLKESVALNRLVIAPAERAEILIDLSDYKIGDKLTLRDSANQLMTLTIT
ncbi:MAG: multicopper oxidase domain-containing protein [Clostridiaceae bacterium]